MKVHILPDLEAISRKAAETFLRLSEQYISSANRFVVALSGGTTPGRFYTLLASDDFRNVINWGRIHYFWVDERCVPKEDEESNFRLAFDTFFSKVPVPASNLHRIKGEENPEKGASDYEKDIRNFFGMPSGLPAFDMIILGMGEDGHTASLFPGSETLKQTERLAAPVCMQQLKHSRITLTIPVINNALQILFLVAGNAKAETLRAVLSGSEEKKRYPAGLINPANGELLWFIDQEAAAALRFRKKPD